MSLKTLKEEVYEANMALKNEGLVVQTWGNASGIDRDKGIIVIKPSGVDYSELRPENMVAVDLDNKVIEGDFKPSSDTKTHTHLYRAFPTIGGVVHTHSTYATAWAQAKRPIPCFGTTHADYVYGEIPCTDVMRDDQIERDYEEETGVQITETMAGKNPDEIPMILVASHAPFTWGKDVSQAVYHAIVLEEVAKMAQLTMTIATETKGVKQAILDKHYLRKHGENAYYGQTN